MQSLLYFFACAHVYVCGKVLHAQFKTHEEPCGYAHALYTGLQVTDVHISSSGCNFGFGLP